MAAAGPAADSLSCVGRQRPRDLLSSGTGREERGWQGDPWPRKGHPHRPMARTGAPSAGSVGSVRRKVGAAVLTGRHHRTKQLLLGRTSEALRTQAGRPPGKRAHVCLETLPKTEARELRTGGYFLKVQHYDLERRLCHSGRWKQGRGQARCCGKAPKMMPMFPGAMVTRTLRLRG